MRAFMLGCVRYRGCAVAQSGKCSGLSASERRHPQVTAARPTGSSTASRSSSAARCSTTRRAPSVFFDGQVMVQAGVYERVPVYADSRSSRTASSTSRSARNRLRVYERRRDGELAGTTGSRTPSFPVESSASAPAGERPVGTTGSDRAGGRGTGRIAVPHAPRTVMETIAARRGTARSNGVWLDFDGARWYSAGASASYSRIASRKSASIAASRSTSRRWALRIRSGCRSPMVDRSHPTQRRLAVYSIFPDPSGCSGG